MYRFGGVALATAAVAASVFVLLSVEHVRHEARASFSSTVSNVDLIVGARTGEINLLLLSIFRIGNPTANVSWESVEAISEQQHVDWVVPISLGDSHKNFRVVGTSAEFFDRYKHGQAEPLVFQDGQRFDATLDVVLGSRVAEELAYQLGDELILSHGMADTSFTHHDQVTFSVTGLLATTGTPVDNALFVSLEAIEAIHADPTVEQSEDQEPHRANKDGHHDEHEEHEQHATHEEHHHEHDHPPVGTVTAILVGLDSAPLTLQIQRWVNEFADEALLAILPGFALAQLWELIGGVEDVLRGISVLVFVSALFGLNAMMLASMRERKREIEILRSIGAPSLFIVALLIIESLLVVTMGVALALAGLLGGIALANNLLASELGLVLSLDILYPSSFVALGLIYLSTLILSLVPAWRAYAVARSYGSS